MVTAVLAQMWEGDHMGGGWWWAMGIGWLAFLSLVVVLLYLLVRHVTGAGRVPESSAGEDVLADRLARGEIDEAEYRRLRDALRSP